MKIEHIREFIALSRNMNYTKTASMLYIDESTLSRHIKLLENELGVCLVLRSHSHNSLTPQGEIALKRFKKIVSECDLMLTEIDDYFHDYDKVLRIGYYSLLGDEFIRPIYPIWRTTFPRTRFDLVSLRAPKTFDDLLRSKIDIALVTLEKLDDTIFGFRCFDEQGVSVMCLEDDVLADCDSVGTKDLQGRAVLCSPFGYDIHGYFALMQKENINVLIQDDYWSFDQFPSQMKDVDNGNALTVVPQYVSKTVKSGFKTIPLSDERFKARTGFLYLRNNVYLEHFLDVSVTAIESIKLA